MFKNVNPFYFHLTLSSVSSGKSVNPMQIIENFSLQEYNTFGIQAYAKFFAQAGTTDELLYISQQTGMFKKPHLVLGGGSNILFTKDFDGTIIKISMRGMEVVDESASNVYLNVNAGENWDDLVEYCVQQSWGGLENLSLIPGQTGSSPIQNIGAYGVELKDHFHSLEALHKQSGQKKTFTAQECKFGYRDSFFKREGRDQYIILSVTFILDKEPAINTSYAALAAELQKGGITQPDIHDIREAVIRIRRSKLPDPVAIGNAGSFFKNPVINTEQYKRLSEAFPDVVSYPDKNGIKIAAGWLIERSGLKGYRLGNAGVHEKQALVLVNYGNAKGSDIVKLAEMIRCSVMENFGVGLEAEVNIV